MNRWIVIVVGALTLAACSEPGVAPGDQDGPVPGYGTVGSHLDLGLQPPVARAPSHGGHSVEAVVNGGFEENGGPGSTTFTGWGTYNSGNGAVLAQTGTSSPISGFPVPEPPGGEYAAMVDQSGPGTHILYQDVVVPKNAQLEFDLFLSNRGGDFHSPDDLSEAVFPNQQFRMDVMDPAAPVDGVFPNEVLATVYRTLPGDPLEGGYDRITFDMSAFQGESVRLRFAEVDNLGFFQVGIDNVTLARATPGGTVSTVGICHRSEGARGYIRINVASPSVPAHLRHGDGMPGEPVPGEPGMVFDPDCVPSPALALLLPEPGAVLDNGCSIGPDPIEWDFDWTDVPGAERYHLFVMGASATIPLVDASYLTTSQYEFRSFGYIAGPNRFGWTWRVRAYVDGAWGPWTEERLFDVEPLNSDCS